MSAVWIAAALLASATAVVVGWPAWRSYRERVARDTQAERYYSWRGRADRSGVPTRAGLTTAERRRLWLAGAQAVVAVACLIIGLSSG